MLKHIINTSMTFGKVTQKSNFLFPVIVPNIQQRFGSKHWNPKFKKLRSEKVIKVELPDFQEDSESLSEEEMRSRMKEKGILPVRPWNDTPIFISCTGGIFEPYVPPEGDGKFSVISKVGAKQKIELVEKKGKSMLAIRKIKSFDESFSTSSFPEIAHNIYIKAHELLAKKDDDIIDYVTEKAYPSMMHNIKNKQIVWKFVQSLEPCKIVHARCTKMHTEDDIFAQVTCRFHTQQILAVYDRFGRLMHGSEHQAKDILEYIVFERHMANEHGIWRIHDKIIPSWMPPKEPVTKTYVYFAKKDEPGQKDAMEQVVPPTAETKPENQPTQ